MNANNADSHSRKDVFMIPNVLYHSNMGEVQGVYETSMDGQVVYSSLPPMDGVGVGAIRMGEAAHAWGMSDDCYGQAGAGWNMKAPMV